jgi:hypothetical protein
MFPSPGFDSRFRGKSRTDKEFRKSVRHLYAETDAFSVSRFESLLRCMFLCLSRMLPTSWRDFLPYAVYLTFSLGLFLSFTSIGAEFSCVTAARLLLELRHARQGRGCGCISGWMALLFSPADQSYSLFSCGKKAFLLLPAANGLFFGLQAFGSGGSGKTAQADFRGNLAAGCTMPSQGVETSPNYTPADGWLRACSSPLQPMFAIRSSIVLFSESLLRWRLFYPSSTGDIRQFSSLGPD